jgi:hypothetical protein
VTTENKPHIVYRANSIGMVRMCANYADAFKYWKLLHSYKDPFLIATVGRVIDPSQEIVDVNE